MNPIKITFGIATLAAAVFAQNYQTVAPTDVYPTTAPAYSAAPVPSSVESVYTTVEVTTSAAPGYSAIPVPSSVESTVVETTSAYQTVPVSSVESEVTSA
ncbi:hypothetical protein FBU59_007224, partial [Linderina macrospora]